MHRARGTSVRRGDRHPRALASSILILVVVLVAATSCSGSGARDDLAQAIEDTSAAVRSVSLAVDLLGHHQTTAAAVEVTARDMADQISTAQQQLVDVPGSDPQVRALRELTQLAIIQAQAAVQQVEDVLAAGEDPASVMPRLAQADQALAETAGAVGER